MKRILSIVLSILCLFSIFIPSAFAASFDLTTQTITVRFDAQGGLFFPSSYKVEAGSTIQDVLDKATMGNQTAAVKPGYKFQYWSTDKEGRIGSNPSYVTLSSDTTLYAIYDELSDPGQIIASLIVYFLYPLIMMEGFGIPLFLLRGDNT